MLAHAKEIVIDDPDGAACAIFAMTVEQEGHVGANANLAWLFEEWKRRKREQLDQREEES